uniref:Anaphase-promoting complex subunit 10 domain-containing protein, putative n=1 Tax=Neospora caninum (strain Liverpool) TaxID=572307 RepID=A0A0F7UCI0_NEOCL|nr:TPA: anaphase-promoting complex subunit 10 domain-containing protein, putative [Neospora caninum Liverpool]
MRGRVAAEARRSSRLSDASRGRKREAGEQESAHAFSLAQDGQETESESDSSNSSEGGDAALDPDDFSSSSGRSSGSEDVEDFFFSDSSSLSSDASSPRRGREKGEHGTAPSSGPPRSPQSPSLLPVGSSASLSPRFTPSRPHSRSSSPATASSSSPAAASSSSPAASSSSASSLCSGQVAVSPLHASSRRPLDWTGRSWWGGGLRSGISVAEVLCSYPARLCGVALPPFEELQARWYELGALAFWQLSSAKDGSGVAQLRDNDSRTFWQSDGAAPHTVTLTFNRLMKISRVDLLVNLQIDESYTPRVVQIKIGDSPASLHVAREAEYEPRSRDEGAAWWSIPLRPTDALRAKHAGRLPFEDAPSEDLRAFYAWLQTIDHVSGFCLQIAVHHTFHEGRDVHIRQIRVYGPDGATDSQVTPACASQQVERGQGRGAPAVDGNERADPAFAPFSLPSFETAHIRLATPPPMPTGDEDREDDCEQDSELEGEHEREEPRDVASYLVRMYYQTQLRRREEGSEAAPLPSTWLLGGEADIGHTPGLGSPADAS